jgi:hypothetical protein
LSVNGILSLFSLCPDDQGQTIVYYNVTGEAAQKCSAVDLLIAAT